MKTRALTLILAAALALFACRTTRQTPPPPAPHTGTGTGTASPQPNPNPEPPSPPPPTPVAVPAHAAPPAAAIPDQPMIATGTAPPAAPVRPHQDVIKLKQAGLTDEFILNRIRADNVNYQLTTADIIELRGAGLSEEILQAMLRSGQSAAATAGAPIARKGEFSGLARVRKSLFGTSTKDIGRLVVDGESVSWFQAKDPDDNFSLYVKNVKEIFNTCVLRPNQNLCLEFGIVTYTGDEYRFRDPGWKNGEHRLVDEATEYFRQAFPNLFFSQRAVNEL
ncbi:MAG TPA: hypothetical protein VK392_01835 [Thermoanaerobaculia bacterium]|nr:hypothetical protein [Thermoanaerobaculia bacterium]